MNDTPADTPPTVHEREAESLAMYGRFDAAATQALIAISKTLRFIAEVMVPEVEISRPASCPPGCECDTPVGRPFADVIMDTLDEEAAL